MPTFQELEDARAHVLMSAEMAKKFGPETATKLGNFAEGIDSLPIPFIGNASPEDVVMDKRNNAFGVKLLQEAGVDYYPLAFVHDEMQLSVAKDQAQMAADISTMAMKDVEQLIKFRCALDSEAQIGNNWADCH